MKTLIVLFAILMLALGSCTETILDEIIRIDTVFIDRPIQGFAPTFITKIDTVVIRDTVNITVVLHDTILHNIHTVDTLIKIIYKDSLIIKEVVKTITECDTVTVTVVNDIHHYDTVRITDTVTVVKIEQRVIYKDTLFVVLEFHPVTWIPNELYPFVVSFLNDAVAYGHFPNGRPLLIQYVDDLPGEDWSSQSYVVGSQTVIELHSSVLVEHHFSSIYREMARLQLNRKYNTRDDIMNILFPPDKVTANSANKSFYLDKLFKKPI